VTFPSKKVVWTDRGCPRRDDEATRRACARGSASAVNNKDARRRTCVLGIGRRPIDTDTERAADDLGSQRRRAAELR